ncbi:MAG: UPF0262 family protein [Hyphomicrobiaceae bacterium]|nr:UPF0262 family protein [Hyphomicrobiaceae bacterium]
MSEAPTAEQPSRDRLFAIDIDEQSIARNNANIEHEREVAIFDLLDGNSFTVEGRDDGPYRLTLAIVENKLQFIVGTETEAAVATHFLSMTPFKRIIKDYFMVCDSYYEAIRTAPPSKIQAIDMGRRGLHDEGSRTLQERLQGKIAVDFDTARRLFTLICALHWKG